jgi:hypothetical protein
MLVIFAKSATKGRQTDGSASGTQATLHPPAKSLETGGSLKMCENDLMQVGSSASLDGLCDRLLRSTAACKVLVCTIEGAVVAHAGERNILRGALSNEIAELAADLIIETQQASHLEIPVEDRYVTLAVPKDNPALGALQLGAAPLGHRALLLVLFPPHVDAGQVRVRVRRARPQMLRLLSTPAPIS